jgi:hypothetical protein
MRAGDSLIPRALRLPSFSPLGTAGAFPLLIPQPKLAMTIDDQTGEFSFIPHVPQHPGDLPCIIAALALGLCQLSVHLLGGQVGYAF